MAVMHKKDSIQLIRDTEGVDNKDRVRILSPGTSPPAVETDVTRQVLYMDLKNTPDDGEPYEYEFTCCTGRKFIPQRSGDANKFEGRTSQEVKRLFADGRSIPAGTGETVTVEANGDRIENVTVYGFTEQAGSGDASPNNVREITVGGLQANLLNHHITSKNVNGVVATKNTDGTITFTGTAAAGAWFNLWTTYQPAITGRLYFSGFTAGFTRCYVYFDKGTTNVDYKMFEDTGNGVSFTASSEFTRMQISVYVPQGTTMNATVGFVLARAKTPYTPYTGAEYSTIVKTKGASEINKLIPLKEPLCEGDTIETRVKSGCDVEVEFDGSDDENWTLSGGKAEGYTKIFIPPTFSLQKDTTMLSPWLAQEPLTSWVQNVGREYIATDGVNLLVCVKTSTTHSMSEARAILKSKPLKMFIKSTAYAEENDVRVCRETHLKRKYHLKISDMNNAEDYPGWKIPELSSIVGSGKNGSIPGTVSSVGNNSTFCNTNVAVGQIFFYTSHWGGLNQSQIKEQYPNLEIDVVLPRAKPLVYAYDPIYIEGYPDGNGVFTVSGEKTVSVELKALQDGGNASKLGGKLPEDYAAVENALGVYTHTKSGTVHSLTGKGDNIRFVATADFAAGDTVQVNGVTCTASTMSGDALWAGFFKSGAVVVCYKNGNSLNFNGGGLAASEVAKITPENLKTGVSVTVNGKQVDGTFTADATATAGSMLSGKTAYVKGEKVTGTIQSKGAATHTPGTADKYITAGVYLSGIQTIKGSPLLLPENIKSGKTIFDVEGTFTADATAVSGDMLSGKTAYVNGEKVTGTIPVYAEKGPSSVFVYNNNLHFAKIPEGYYAASYANTPGIVAALSVVASAIGLTSDKLLAGNTICGVAGGIPNRAAIEAAHSIVTSGGAMYIRLHQGAYLTNASSGCPEISVPLETIGSVIGLTSSILKAGATLCGVRGSVQSIVPVASAGYGNVLAKEAAGSSYLQTGMSSGWADGGYGALQNIGAHGYGQLTGMYIEWRCNVSGTYTITPYGEGSISHSGTVWLNAGTVVRLTFAEPTDIYWRDRKSGGFMVAYNS